MKIITINDNNIEEFANCVFPDKYHNVVQSTYIAPYGIYMLQLNNGTNNIFYKECNISKMGQIITFDEPRTQIKGALAAHTQSLRYFAYGVVSNQWFVLTSGPQIYNDGQAGIKWGLDFLAINNKYDWGKGIKDINSFPGGNGLLTGFEDIFQHVSGHPAVLKRVDFAVDPNTSTATFMLVDNENNTVFASFDLYTITDQQSLSAKPKYDKDTHLWSGIPFIKSSNIITSGYVPHSTWEKASQDMSNPHEGNVSFQGISRNNYGTLYLASQFGPNLGSGSAGYARGIYKISEKSFETNDSSLWTYFQFPTFSKIDLILPDGTYAITELEDVQMTEHNYLYLTVAYHEPSAFKTVANKIFKVMLPNV